MKFGERGEEKEKKRNGRREKKKKEKPATKNQGKRDTGDLIRSCLQFVIIASAKTFDGSSPLSLQEAAT